MPIRPENRDRYPADWKLRSRFVREHRARNRCEWCGVRQYDVGHRDERGQWVSVAGGRTFDRYADARQFAADYDYCYSGEDGGRLVVVIVLTVAHVHDDRPEASGLLNLAALCQRCHNRHDAAARRQGTRERRIAESGQLALIA